MARKRVSMLLMVAVLAPMALVGGGCQSDAQTGGLIGAGVGAAAGAGIDHNNRGRGAAIGAGVGAVGGYIFGNESDKNKAREREQSHRYDY